MIFLGGVHGVGKSSMCTEVAGKIELGFFSASSIISQEKTSRSLDSRTTVHDMKDNQYLLLRGIEKIQRQRNLFILDGHFSLRQKNNKILPIPLDVFINLGVKYILLINDNPLLIANRLSVRDNLFYAASDIELLQLSEIDNAKHISSSMGIPLSIIKAFDHDDFLNCLKTIIMSKQN